MTVFSFIVYAWILDGFTFSVTYKPLTKRYFSDWSTVTAASTWILLMGQQIVFKMYFRLWGYFVLIFISLSLLLWIYSYWAEINFVSWRWIYTTLLLLCSGLFLLECSVCTFSVYKCVIENLEVLLFTEMQFHAPERIFTLKTKKTSFQSFKSWSK